MAVRKSTTIGNMTVQQVTQEITSGENEIIFKEPFKTKEYALTRRAADSTGNNIQLFDLWIGHGSFRVFAAKDGVLTCHAIEID